MRLHRCTGDDRCLRSTRGFAGSIRKDYDRYIVPLIFEGYAQDIVRRAAEIAPRSGGNSGRQRCGDSSAGAGARPGATYVVTDLNQPMLDYAAAQQGADRRISWSTADAQGLPVRRCCL